MKFYIFIYGYRVNVPNFVTYLISWYGTLNSPWNYHGTHMWFRDEFWASYHKIWYVTKLGSVSIKGNLVTADTIDCFRGTAGTNRGLQSAYSCSMCVGGRLFNLITSDTLKWLWFPWQQFKHLLLIHRRPSVANSARRNVYMWLSIPRIAVHLHVKDTVY
jgi:hypothetical protein